MQHYYYLGISKQIQYLIYCYSPSTIPLTEIIPVYLVTGCTDVIIIIRMNDVSTCGTYLLFFMNVAKEQVQSMKHLSFYFRYYWLKTEKTHLSVEMANHCKSNEE